MPAKGPEEFPDYQHYLEEDTWPDVGGKETWVGDMAPQHAAAAIYKLQRWAKSQWADEMRNEQEWARVMATRLYRHLAAKATAQDFTGAVDVQFYGGPVNRRLDLQEGSVALLYALAPHLDMDKQDAVKLGEIAYAITKTLYENFGYSIHKEST